MTHFKSNAYILVILALFLSSLPIANSQRDIPVTYRAEYIPFGKGLTWKEAIPSGGGALGLEVEFVFSPGTVTAEVAGEIRFSEDTRTIAIQGTGGQLKSDGGVVLKGDIVMNFTVPLPEAFFQEDDDPHINYRVPIPGLNINKGWNESEAFNSLLLNSSRPESVKLDIRIPQLVTIQLSAVEIVPVVASAILSGGTLTTAVKIFVNNLSDYLDAGISLYGGIASELTLAGKTITLNGATITHENRLIRAPDFDPSEETYQIQSGYDEEFTYTLDIVASSNAYAKVTVLGGIEIWSYDQPFAEKRVPIIPKNTFDLNFGGAATSATIDAPPEPLNAEAGPGVIPDPALADSIRRKLNIRPDDPITRNDMRKLTELWLVNRGVRNLTGFEHAINLTKLDLSDNAISEVSLSNMPNLLMKLDLSGNAISEVSLSNMSNLEDLDLSGNPLSKVFLSNMSSLTRLVGFSDNAISEVSLANMPNLESLRFGGSTISKLSMSGLTNLTELSVGARSISEVSLSDMPSLESLYLAHNAISEVSLADMPNLESLKLYSNALSKVSLSGMSSLIHLDLSDNALSEISLPDMPNLELLGLSNNTLSEVSLPDMPNLEYLSLFNNTLSEISLPDMPNLEYLNLSNNVLSEVSLPDMPNLRYLGLVDNALSEVSLPDIPNLEHLGLGNNVLSEVSLPDMPNLEYLSLFNNTLSEVSLPDMPNLESLSLSGNNLSKVSLSDMPNLTRLYLEDNPTSKLSLSELPSLTELYLPIRSPGRLEKVSLSGLPNLKVDSLFLGITLSKLSMSGFANMMALYLRGCSISEISLSDMPNLTQLYLSDNAISDVSGLSDLKNLESLDLSNNAVSDVSPLTEFPNLTELYLPNNPVNFASRRTYIPAMQARGVFVWFDERVSPILVKISGEDQIGAPGLALPTPFVVQALDVEDKPMSGIPIKFAVAQGRGELSTTTVRTDATGKAQTTLTLGPNPGTNTVAVIAEAFEKAVSFTATAVVNAVTPLRIAEDVNGDGIVNIQDLVLVSSHLGEVGENAADVNGDGVVNIQDLVKVSAALQ